MSIVQQCYQVTVEAVHALGAQADELLAPVRDQTQRHSTVIGAHFGEIRSVQADQGDGVGVDVVILAAVAAGEHGTSAARRVDTSTTRSPAATSR
jgi:uncharacterized protein YcfJ